MKFTLFLLTSILILQSSCTTHSEKEGQSEKEKFHIYLLLGQSNMAGRGEIHDIDTIQHPRIYMLDKDTNWTIAKNPLHFDKPWAGLGPGLTFGKKMAEQDTTVRIGLIPCAKGGSSIDYWFAGQLHKQSKSHPYDEAISRIKKGMTKGVIKGILWHQGEADSGTKENMETYKGKFLAFRDNLEKDLGIKEIPIVIGEIGYFLQEKKKNSLPYANDINSTLQEIASGDEYINLVKSDNLTHRGDTVHFSSESYRILGARYATEMLQLQKKVKK